MEILKKIGIPDYLTYFLRNPYAGQEVTFINSAVMNIGGTPVSFPSGFPQCVYPVVGLLDHKAVLFPVF